MTVTSVASLLNGFGTYLLAVAVLGGGSAITALLARAALRRMLQKKFTADDEQVVRARRAFAVGLMIASGSLTAAITMSLMWFIVSLWLLLVVLLAATAIMGFVAFRLRPYLRGGEAFANIAVKLGKRPKGSTANRTTRTRARSGKARDVTPRKETSTPRKRGRQVHRPRD